MVGRPRKRRFPLSFLLAGIAILGAVLYLVYINTQANAVYYMTVPELKHCMTMLSSSDNSFNLAVIWLILAIVLMAGIIALTWFLLRARRRRSSAQFQRSRERGRKKTAKDGTTQVVAPADRKQELLEELLVLDQAYEAGKLDEAIYRERRNKTKAQLRSLMEV